MPKNLRDIISILLLTVHFIVALFLQYNNQVWDKKLFIKNK